ncbi:MAG: hypothetical protein IPH08_03970 [Rhodocyclaceae bacterium]|nr:hypothetical protein [Rhodocyclaceae bacterium]
MNEWEVKTVSVWRMDGEEGEFGVSASLEQSFREDTPPVLQLGQSIVLGMTTFKLDEVYLARRERTWVANLSAKGLPFAEAEAFLNGWVRERV